MARRTKRANKPPAGRPPKPIAPAPPPVRPAEAPRSAASFWFDFSVPWVKVLVLRVALFGVLAIDAFLAVRHAPRYGSGFNVGNLRALDELAPGRAAFAVIELALAYLFTLFAVGVATRLVPLAAALYGWVYFSSQLDSYQHHYLVFLVLVLASFADWAPREGRDAVTPMRSWALRLILVQLGIVYAWAAISKLTGVWLDGSALHEQISTPWMIHLIERVPGGWATAARFTLALEVFLAIAIWCRPLWPIALPLGVAFHVGIELSGLQIGLFSYVMVALYTLAIPDHAMIGVARFTRSIVGGAAVPVRAFAKRVGGWPLIAPALLVTVLAIVVLVGRIPVVPWVIVALIAVGAITGTLGTRLRSVSSSATRVLFAHVVVALALFTLDAATSVSNDYYRFWGGSARRLGRVDEAREAYERLVAIDPSSVTGHYWLGSLDAGAARDDSALAHWHAAELADPNDARAFLAEARWLAAKGRGSDALAVARKAAAADPNSADARALVQTLTPKPSGTPSAPP
jgi:hypothetical protein